MNDTKANTAEADKKKAGNLGDNYPNQDDNLLRMGAAAVSGMGDGNMAEKLSGGANSFMAIGGSEGYTGDETSGGGADPNEDEGSGTGSGFGSDVKISGTSDTDDSDRVDTTVNPGNLGTDEDDESIGTKDAGESEAGGIGAP